MKTIKYLSMLLMMVALSVSFVSCGDDDEPGSPAGNSSIIGSWESNDWIVGGREATIRVEFQANKKGVMTVVYEDNNIDPDSYRFEFVLLSNDGRDILTIYWTGSNGGPLYEEDEEYEVKVSSGKLSWGKLVYNRK